MTQNLRPRELMVASLGLLLVMLAAASVSGMTVLFTRPLWLDEYHTVMIVSEPTVGRSLRALLQGGDYNPPLLYLLLRPLTLGTRTLSAFELRAAAFGTVWLALVAIYWTLRHDFDRLPSFVGTIAVWGHPVVVHSAFDGRYYGPMLFFAALVAYALRDDAVESPRRRWVLAGASVGLCTIHYFGVFALLLAVSARIIASQSPTSTARNLTPALAGPISLALCAPFYFGQKHALSVSTWIAAPSVSQVLNLFQEYYAYLPVVGLLFAGVIWALVRGRTSLQQSALGASNSAWPVMAAFGAFPIILVAFSLLIQPSIEHRYAIVTILALALVPALIASQERRWVQIAVLALLLGVGFREVLHEGEDARAFELRIRDLAEVVADNVPVGGLVVVPSRIDLYPLAHTSSREPAELVFPTFPRSTIDEVFPSTGREERLRRLVLLEQDVAEVHSKIFGFPSIARSTDIASRDTLFLLGGGGMEAPHYAGLFLPQYRPERISDELYLLIRKERRER